jgi:hypothetical protein
MARRGLAGRQSKGALIAAGALALVALAALVPVVSPVRAAALNQVPERCTITGTKTALPARVLRGDPVEIRLRIKPSCPGETFRDVDLVMVIDQSRSMAEAAGGAGTQTKETAAKTAAKTFVDTALATGRTRVALVTFGGSANLGIGLSTDAVAIKRAVDSFPLLSGTNISAGIDMAFNDVLTPNARAGAIKVIIVMSDGAPNAPAPNPDTAAVRSANAARLGGTQLYAIGLGSDRDDDLLKRVAGSASNYYPSPTGSDLEQVYRSIALLVGNFAVQNMVLDDDLSGYVQYIPGSARPEAEVAGSRLTWKANLIPEQGFTMTYRVTAMRVGTWPTNDKAVATFINADGKPDSYTFPKPQITIVEPPPEGPTCTGTNWWTLAIHSFPDSVGISGGSATGCNNRFDGGDWLAGTGKPLPKLEYEIKDAAGKTIFRSQGVPGPGRVDQRIYARVCVPPPYTVRLLTTNLGGYGLCSNLAAERRITLRDFRPASARRTELRFGYVPVDAPSAE